MPTVQEVVKDPDFIGLPVGERRKVLMEIDEDFKGLPMGEQMKVVSSFGKPLEPMPSHTPGERVMSAADKVKEYFTGDIRTSAKGLSKDSSFEDVAKTYLGKVVPRNIAQMVYGAVKSAPQSMPGGPLIENVGQAAAGNMSLSDALKTGLRQSIIAPVEMAGGALENVTRIPRAIFSNEAREKWAYDPVGTGLGAVPLFELANRTPSMASTVKNTPIPGSAKYYKLKAGQQLLKAAGDERGAVGREIPGSRVKTDLGATPKPELAKTTEASNAASVAELKQRVPIEPTLAQETGSVPAALLEQSLAAKDPTLAEVLKYKDAQNNQLGLRRLQETLGKGRELPLPEESQATGSKIVNKIEAERIPAKEEVSRLYKELPDVPIDNSPIMNAVLKLREQNLPRSQKAKLAELADYIESELGDGETTNFQKLHAVRKTVGDIANDAMKGTSPDRITSTFAGGLKRAIDEAIDKAGDQLPDAFKTAKAAYQNYADRFYSGDVAKVLQKGQEITGLKIPEEKIGARFFTPTGADSLIRAVGANDAKGAMRQHAVSDLIARTTDPEGNMNINRSMAWLRKNKPVLDKYGLTEEVKGLVKGQVPKAINSTIESKRLNVLNDPMLTANEARKLVRDYRPALKELYKDNPGALQALDDFHRITQILSRNKQTTYGGGSNTVEKLAMSDFFTDAAKKGLSGWASRVTRGISDLVTGYGEKQVNALLKDAILNPDTAKALMDLAENTQNRKAAATLSKRLTELGVQASGRLKDEKGLIGFDLNTVKDELRDIGDEVKQTFTPQTLKGRQAPPNPYRTLYDKEQSVRLKKEIGPPVRVNSVKQAAKNTRDALIQEIQEIREELMSMIPQKGASNG